MKESLLTGVFGAVALCGLMLCSALAAGPYDGQWKASTSYTQKKCPGGDFSVTVADNKISGVFKGMRGSYDLSGTIAADGSAKGTFGRAGFTGKFSGDQFSGSFPPPEQACGMARLEMQRSK